MRVLLCGESWVTHSLHIKGVDSFTTSSYTEGAGRLREALAASGIDAEYLPGHLVPAQFPGSAGELAGFDVVILSDIGANSLLLSPDTFERSAVAPNRIDELGRYVSGGGGLLMIGGYLSFAGIDGKARYHGTAVEYALPVTIGETDDPGGDAAGGCARCGQPGPSGPGRTAGGLARTARLQPGDGQAGRDRGGHGGGRPADRVRRARCRAGRRVHVGLRPALGPAGLHGLARLCPAVGQPGDLAGRRRLILTRARALGARAPDPG
jgi:Putative glutamine amidotransferase